jgi:hypothetical protein
MLSEHFVLLGDDLHLILWVERQNLKLVWIAIISGLCKVCSLQRLIYPGAHDNERERALKLLRPPVATSWEPTFFITSGRTYSMVSATRTSSKEFGTCPDSARAEALGAIEPPSEATVASRYARRTWERRTEPVDHPDTGTIDVMGFI